MQNLLICVCIGDGDHIGMKINGSSNEMIDRFYEEIPMNWKTIGFSSEGFVKTLIQEEGRKVLAVKCDQTF